MTAILNGHMREFLASFDENVHLTDQQVEGVIADLDDWNQSRDGVYQLQTDGQENRARLYTILSERIGLNYQQAPKFFDNAHKVLLDHSIAGVPEQRLPDEGSEGGAPVAEAGAAATTLMMIAEPMAGLEGQKDLQEIDRLVHCLELTEKSLKAQIPLPSFGPKPLPSFDDASYKLSQVQKFREEVLALRAEVDAGAQSLRSLGRQAGQDILSHPEIGMSRTVLAARLSTLREMAAYYDKKQSLEIRQSDVDALKLLLNASRNVNTLFAQWKPPVAEAVRAVATTPRAIPAVVTSGWRSAVAGVGAQLSVIRAGVVNVGTRFQAALPAVRAMANGVVQFLTPVRNWAAGLDWRLAAGVGMCIGAVGVLGYLETHGPRGEVLLMPPSKQPEPKQPEPKPAAPAEKPAPVIPTISIDALPPAPARTTARTARGK